MPDGAILSNRWLERMVMKYVAEHPDAREDFEGFDDARKKAILKDAYASNGFDYISLDSSDGDLGPTFLKKAAAAE